MRNHINSEIFWTLFCYKLCLKSCFTRNFLSGRFFSNFPTNLAGQAQKNLATVVLNLGCVDVGLGLVLV
jgi:hypothetical protein